MTPHHLLPPLPSLPSPSLLFFSLSFWLRPLISLDVAVCGGEQSGWEAMRRGHVLPLPPTPRHPLWYLEVQAHLPPLVPVWAAPGGRRGWWEGEAGRVWRGWGVAAALSPCSVAALICCFHCASGSPSLSSPPSPILRPLRGSPLPLPFCPPGVRGWWPALLVTALFLIDLSYLGSVVETSLSSAQ